MLISIRSLDAWVCVRAFVLKVYRIYRNLRDHFPPKNNTASGNDFQQAVSKSYNVTYSGDLIFVMYLLNNGEEQDLLNNVAREVYKSPVQLATPRLLSRFKR